MSLRLALLGVLAYGEHSGYDVLREFDTVISHVWQASQAQIYGELRRLSEEGLVSVGAPQARNRRPYQLTEQGLSELRRLVGDTEPDHTQRNESLLRAFFLWTVPNEIALRYLDTEERHYRDRLSHMRALVAALPATTRSERAARLAAEAGAFRLQAMLDWIDQARAEIGQWPPD